MDLQGPDMQDTQIAGSPVASWSSTKGPVPGEEIFRRTGTEGVTSQANPLPPHGGRLFPVDPSNEY